MIEEEARPSFWQAALVSAGTGALFMALYHACNFYAAGCGRMRMWYADWELSIPVVAWLIVPYWSIDLLFGIAPFLCTKRSELRTLAGRLTLAILLACACFVAWPLQLAHVRVDDHGVFTPLFTAIHGFDKPHNLFPSLHVAFAIILRWTFHRHLRGVWRLLFHVWFACITVSTVLVHQHHLVDVVGGAILAVLCCYLIAEDSLPAARIKVSRHDVALAVRYLAGSVACLGLAWWFGRWWWLLAWPTLAFAMASAAYLGVGAAVFRKDQRGLPWSSRFVLGPWLFPLVWSRRWWWRRDQEGAASVCDGVWIGRLPDAALLRRFRICGVLDLTAEHDGLKAEDGLSIERLPMLDLATPRTATLQDAVAAIERLRVHGPVLVHCALGYGRSAAVVAAWLQVTGRAKTPAAAATLVAAARTGAHISPQVLAALPIARPAIA